MLSFANPKQQSMIYHPIIASMFLLLTTAVLISTSNGCCCCWALSSSNPSSITTTTTTTTNSNHNNHKPIPITVLSGFLGTGKTTLLQNMLQNKQGLRIGVVVNDVASVNIDSKLVANAGGDTSSSSSTSTTGTSTTSLQSADGMVELQNGCACCSLSDELLSSVANLVTLSDLKEQSGEDEDDDHYFHHIVIELSGVADPKAIRAKFQEATMEQMPLMERVQLDTMVSLVDCSTFESYFTSTQLATPKEMPELFGGNDSDQDIEEEWMAELSPRLKEVVLQSIRGGPQDDQGQAEGVADLLTSQTETADLVVLNKQDLVSPQELSRLSEIVGALNPRAKVITTTYGQVDLHQVLGIAQGWGVASAGAVDDHRDYVDAAATTATTLTGTTTSHSHSHDHKEEASLSSSSSSSHSHGHDHQATETTCEDPTCTDPSHSHSHSHDDHAGAEEVACTDPSHSHDHDHDHTATSSSSSCEDPTCTDPTHTHSHSHDHKDPATYVGIGSFVYQARRPFHPGRLLSFLRYLPVSRGIPTKDDGGDESLQVSPETQATLKQCLRSKGFVWSASSHTDALYWSHAGSTFELSCLGHWWATLPRDQWPAGVDEYVLRDFDTIKHDDTTNNVGVGDRRQEIVFIGPTLGDGTSQKLVTDTLDQCLLTDDEWDDYQRLSKDAAAQDLATRFPKTLESRYVTY